MHDSSGCSRVKRLLLTIVILIVVFAVLSAAARAYGRSLPLPEEVRKFGLWEAERCNRDTPCVLGVVPGKTNWADAQKIVAGINRVQVSVDRIWIPFNPETYIGFFLYGDIVGTSQTSISPAGKDSLSLGWLLALYGAPCTISHVRGGPIGLYGRHMYAFVITDNDRLDLFDKIMIVTFPGPGPIRVQNGCDTTDEFTSIELWRGFSTLKRYEHR